MVKFAEKPNLSNALFGMHLTQCSIGISQGVPDNDFEAQGLSQNFRLWRLSTAKFGFNLNETLVRILKVGKRFVRQRTVEALPMDPLEALFSRKCINAVKLTLFIIRNLFWTSYLSICLARRPAHLKQDSAWTPRSKSLQEQNLKSKLNKLLLSDKTVRKLSLRFRCSKALSEVRIAKINSLIRRTFTLPRRLFRRASLLSRKHNQTIWRKHQQIAFRSSLFV